MKPKKIRSKVASNKIEHEFTKFYSDEELVMYRQYDIEKLKHLVAETNAHVLKAKSDMEANKEYQKAKAILEDFRAGFTDVRKYADAKKMLCLYLLQTKGIVDIGEEEID